MSISRRKITYYSIEFMHGDQQFFDASLFCKFMRYLKSMDDVDRIFNDVKTNKAIDFNSVLEETKQGIQMFKITFKSCKYNHSPDYMSSIDGSERHSDKRLEEGEKELTHVCMKIKNNEAYTIFEQRRNGVSVYGMIQFFNKQLKTFLESQNINDNFYLFASVIPADDFLTALEKVERIRAADIYTEKEIIGSEFLNLMPTDTNMQDELVISVKAKRKESLAKRSVKQAFQSVFSEGTRIKRIRLYAKDIEKLDVVLDSLGEKKVDEITVELNENGTVNTYSIFSKIEELMGVSE